MGKGNQLFDPAGRLFFGDNLEVLKRHLGDETVDLVYLDPPFNSDRTYNLLFSHRDGRRAAAQVQAFDDTWRWDRAAADLYHDVVQAGGDLARALTAFRDLIGASDMLAYLTMMAPRLSEMHRVLKSTGSLYLHCDPTASHYLKLLLDAVFGPENFRNEIIWRRTGANKSRERFGPIHQVILFYTKTQKAKFNVVNLPYTRGYVDGQFKYEDERGRFRPVLLTGPGVRNGDSGEAWRGYDPTARGRHWQPSSYVYDKYLAETGQDLAQWPLLERLDKLDEAGLLYCGKDGDGAPNYRFYLADAPGVPAQDIWAFTPGTEGCIWNDPKAGIDEDVKWIGSNDAERLGYPTQKPVGLLERIIAASTDKDDVVLDPFCGCGTTIDAALKMGRKWIGIDVTALSIDIIRDRLTKQHPHADYELRGEPSTIDEAVALADLDKHEFQRWVCERLGVKPPTKKGADRGIDGEMFGVRSDGSTWRAIVEVKGGGVKSEQVRSLRGTVSREAADFGLFVTLKAPSAAMKKEAAEADYVEPGVPRLQILTVKELLDGRWPDVPAAPAPGALRVIRGGRARSA